jgi:hypothetical protein
MLTSKNGENKVELISDSSYHTQREFMSETKDDEFIFPCINTVGKDAIYIKYWYSNRIDRGHFGLPKVIFSMGRSASTLIDRKGEMGLTQFAYAIIDDVNNLENIKKAMDSEKFIELMKYSDSINSQRYNRRIIATFRKDFWKEFID